MYKRLSDRLITQMRQENKDKYQELYKVYLRIPTKSGDDYYIPASLAYSSYTSAVAEALRLTKNTGNYYTARRLEGIEHAN